MRAMKRPAARCSKPLAALLVCLAATVSGCASSQIVAQSSQLCQDWRIMDREKADRLTERTASNMEASNKARIEWGCHPRENRAKAG